MPKKSKDDKKINAWVLIPSRDPDDQLFNRRLISYFTLAYSALWFVLVLVLVLVCVILNNPLEAAVVASLLGVPASLTGLGVWNYLSACKKEDKAVWDTQNTTDGEKKAPEEGA